MFSSHAGYVNNRGITGSWNNGKNRGRTGITEEQRVGGECGQHVVRSGSHNRYQVCRHGYSD